MIDKLIIDESIELYPLGIDDPDYTVLCFTTEWGNYYRHLKNVTFDVKDLTLFA